MAQYLFVDHENGDVSQNPVLSDDDRELVANETLEVFRFTAGKFERLVVESEENDDGDIEYPDSWEAV